jgi:hypothetical protein
MIAFVVSLGAAQPAHVSGQDGKVKLIGRVIDADSRDPIDAVSIRIAESNVLSDRNGRFIVTVAPGFQPISVERIGYAPRQDTLNVVQAESGDLEIRLSRKPVQLPPITAVARSEWLAESGFYERRDRGGFRGTYIGKQEIERRTPRH